VLLAATHETLSASTLRCRDEGRLVTYARAGTLWEMDGSSTRRTIGDKPYINYHMRHNRQAYECSTIVFGLPRPFSDKGKIWPEAEFMNVRFR
jgi:hypothetical protein